MSYNLNGGFTESALKDDRKFSTMLPTRVPEHLRYNECSVGPAGQRQEVEFRASGGNSFTYQNTKITIPIQSQGILDFKHAYFEFYASCSATGGTSYFTNGIWNWIERVCINNGSVNIFQQNNKNAIRSLQWAFVRESETDATLGAACWGVDSIANRTAKAGGANYAIPLDISFLCSEEMPFVNVNNFEIEFYLAPPSAVVCYGTATSAPTYTIANPKIRCWESYYQPDLQGDIVNLPVILYPHTNYKLFQFSVPAGSNQNQLTIPIKSQGIKRFIAFWRPTADINNPAVSDVFVSDFQNNSTATFQLKIDNTYYPPQPYKAANDANGYQQAYLSAMRCLNREQVWSGDQLEKRNNGESEMPLTEFWQCTGAEFLSNKFIMAVDVKSWTGHTENMLTKFDTNPGNTSVQLNVTLASGQPATAQTLFVYVIHSSIVLQYKDGRFLLIE